MRPLKTTEEIRQRINMLRRQAAGQKTAATEAESGFAEVRLKVYANRSRHAAECLEAVLDAHDHDLLNSPGVTVEEPLTQRDAPSVTLNAKADSEEQDQ
jgi:hypothetical protein